MNTAEIEQIEEQLDFNHGNSLILFACKEVSQKITEVVTKLSEQPQETSRDTYLAVKKLLVECIWSLDDDLGVLFEELLAQEETEFQD